MRILVLMFVIWSSAYADVDQNKNPFDTTHAFSPETNSAGDPAKATKRAKQLIKYKANKSSRTDIPKYCDRKCHAIYKICQY